MNLQEKVRGYLEYCEFRKELDKNTLKAYRIDLRQFFEQVGEEVPSKERIEEYITKLHKNSKKKNCICKGFLCISGRRGNYSG